MTMNRYRMAGALCCATGLLALTAAAQVQDDPRTTRPNRPAGIQATAQDAQLSRHLEELKPLVGTWDVEMRILPATDRPAGDAPAYEGTATRTWTLNQTLLQEIVALSATDALTEPDADRPGAGRPGEAGQNPAARETRHPNAAQLERMIQGMGLFGYDRTQEKFSHLWADTLRGGMILSMGEYDPSTQTFTYRTHYGEGAPRGHDPLARPEERLRDRGIDRDRFGEDEGMDDEEGLGDEEIIGEDETDDDELEVFEEDQEDDEFGEGGDAWEDGGLGDEDTDLFGQDEPRLRDAGRAMDRTSPLVTLRVVSPDRHVITMLRHENGRLIERYEITYTRKGAQMQDRPGLEAAPNRTRDQGQGQGQGQGQDRNRDRGGDRDRGDDGN